MCADRVGMVVGSKGLSPAERVASLSAAGAVLLGIAGLAGWGLRLPRLTRILPQYKAIAPSVAVALVILGVILLRQARGRRGSVERTLAAVVAALISLFGLLEIIGFFVGADLNREDALTGYLAQSLSIPFETMSPVAGALLFLVGAAMLVLLLQPAAGESHRSLGSAAGILGLASGSVASVFVLGYAYRTPLLYGSRAIPIAATAALGSLLLSIGAVATAGPSHWPLRALAGVSARARLLRTFVPLTVFVVIASFIVHDQADALGHLNHALLASMLGTASALTAGIVVSRVAQAIGESLDRAQLARQQAERALAQQERARAELAETLNVEISHRVKNNLTTAAGLLQMQVAGQSDPQVVGMLQDTIARLYAFANVHEQLVATLGAEIELLGALRKIADSIQSVFPRENVAVSVEGGEIACPAKTATALCLVVNELMTNAIKHGAPGSEGQLEVAVRLAREAGKLELSVWNSGNPVPAGLDPSKQRGMGLSLVQGLVGQYRGSFALQPDNGGSLAWVVLSEEVLWGSP